MPLRLAIADAYVTGPVGRLAKAAPAMFCAFIAPSVAIGLRLFNRP